MNEKVNQLKGGNLDIDLVTKDNIDWKQTECPWNRTEGVEDHRCAVKNTSICKYFCGVKYLDSVLCSYPYENREALSPEEMDREF